MGLSNTSFSWSRQVRPFLPLSPSRAATPSLTPHPSCVREQIKHFTSRPHEFSLLVFDNRGSGYSGYPTGRWTTSSMARDTRGLLDHVGWTGEKEVHVVGISMGAFILSYSRSLSFLPFFFLHRDQKGVGRDGGRYTTPKNSSLTLFRPPPLIVDWSRTGGMISLELARLIPERILSLTLCVTSSGHGIWRNLPPVRPHPPTSSPLPSPNVLPHWENPLSSD